MSVMKRSALLMGVLFAAFSPLGPAATAHINNRVDAPAQPDLRPRQHGKVRRTAQLPSGAARQKRAARKLRNIRARCAK